jgi:hypothetical protein
VASLEDHAIRRDKRFLVRLVLMLVVGAIGGLWAFGHLTSGSFGTCAAETFGEVTPPASGR